ncbi:MAG: hypothetical protein IKX51_07380 [Bacteroidales bacterium]|nr:hypothetical protein [Bacteroidales bacterium]
MKNIKSRFLLIISTVLFLSFTESSFAQLKVDALGRVLLGTPYTPHDLYGVTSMSVFGKYGTYKAGSKLSFGDFGRRDHNGWNVFVGEFGDNDSDKLWLHGKRGFYLTVGNGFELASYDYMFSPSLPWTTDWVGRRSINVRTNINASRIFTRFRQYEHESTRPNEWLAYPAYAAFPYHIYLPDICKRLWHKHSQCYLI